MLIVLLINVFYLSLLDFAPARWAFLMLGHFVHDIAAKLIFLNHTRHKPISVKADQVESVEAFFHAHKVRPARELLIVVVVLVEVLQADSTPAADGVIILSQNFSNFVMRLINKPIIILILLLLIRYLLNPKTPSYSSTKYLLLSHAVSDL